MAKSGGKLTQNIAGTDKIGKAELYNGSAKCSKPHHFPPCMFIKVLCHSQCSILKPMNVILVVQIKKNLSIILKLLSSRVRLRQTN